MPGRRAPCSSANLADSEQLFVVWEIVRRIGASLHPVAIAVGLVMILGVLRFPSVRLGELAAAATARRRG